MKQFKTESKRILDLMINSIYTNKEIFLRELISNASDAIDKLHFVSLTDSSVNNDFAIKISVDESERSITISDNGIGMDKDGLDKNLGTIASSGTLAFKKENEDQKDLIGQFGVGFYSAFMVAKRVEVKTLAYNSDVAYLWVSEGVEGYSVEETVKEDGVGTSIKILLKDDDSENEVEYSSFLSEYTLRNLVKKYSDYIRYPIKMEVTKSRKKEDSEEYETYKEEDTLNSMIPVWKKNKSEISEEEYESFYAMRYYDFEKPLKVVHANVDGNVSYTALLYFPAKPPMDFYTKEFKKGLSLYSNGVLIMDKCEEILPDYFSFVKGVVDSSDLSLNISREILQQDRQLKAIATGIEKKIASELKKMLEDEREGYEKLFEQFGLSIKFGVYNNYGAKKEQLKDLILFYSSKDKKFVTLKEYKDNMKQEQEFIYYACGEDLAKIDLMPQVELLKSKGYEVLFLKDDVDEFVLKILQEYDGKKFKSVSDKDLNLDSKEEKEEMEDKAVSNKDLTEFIKGELAGKIESVELKKLGAYPVCLSYEGEVSLEMEKVFKNMKNASPMPVVAKKVLCINADHKILEKLRDLFNTDHETLKKYANMLYTQAMLLEGFEVENLSEYFMNVSDLMIK